MFEKILTVCTGNICRSPLAEFLLRERLAAAGKKVEVRSAGIGALVGHPADDTTQDVARKHGTALDGHRAQQLDTELTRWADLILVMEKHHFDAVTDLDPTARGKTFYLGHWNKAEIPDPYRRGEDVHEEVHQAIAGAVEKWIAKL
ncbi:low molecular weight phosphotyrosine protein phosphatase [Azoarcus sp. L1K30]|uniref:low molecular weight protein-tyrosine-phosphatase n=1 Tax=Azoarcus sp. L1K30 TaxID=2820277 RepID=UPI001B80FEEF|nr:low molecular weight protein-tyrosine-phosphatase [Azoarcus sp. L1K30]MBR0564513.1 low molecular weight phosphotyrosine protein phosphatase [Azoarcus sp. L1K30]